jgi:hypothetical protein
MLTGCSQAPIRDTGAGKQGSSFTRRCEDIEAHLRSKGQERTCHLGSVQAESEEGQCFCFGGVTTKADISARTWSPTRPSIWQSSIATAMSLPTMSTVYARIAWYDLSRPVKPHDAETWIGPLGAIEGRRQRWKPSRHQRGSVYSPHHCGGRGQDARPEFRPR